MSEPRIVRARAAGNRQKPKINVAVKAVYVNTKSQIGAGDRSPCALEYVQVCLFVAIGLGAAAITVPRIRGSDLNNERI